MKEIIPVILLVIFTVSLLFIFFYALSQLHLAYHYLRSKKFRPPLQLLNKNDDHPFVTIQLPVYNELYVAARLIDAVAELDYPWEKLEIQVLDDSTDETVRLIAEKVRHYRKKGHFIQQIRRKDRTGFKAGALQNGLLQARGDFLAIFDADFIPQKDFLIKTLPWFSYPETGVVQTHWQHLNRNYSLFTRTQAFALDAHFKVEQSGRNHAGYFINFNGTAGIWRKSTILEAGGWKADTLTEDLDLSYRAQLKGWKIKYLEEVGSPAELPAEINSIKSQQFRWTKGGAETARKLFPRVLRSKLPLGIKIHSFFHLFNSSVFIFILICSVVSIPVLLINENSYSLWFKLSSGFLLGLVIVGFNYFIAFRQEFKKKWKAFMHFLYMYPLFLCFSMGLSLHNGLAVIQGFLGMRSSFIRTPKFNLVSPGDHWKGKKYLKKSPGITSMFEGLLTLYFASGLYMAFVTDDFRLFSFHLMLTAGFGSLFFYSLGHSLMNRKK